MKLMVMALFDQKVGEFMTPFFAQSHGAAVRSLDDLVNGRGEEAPNRHPEDFRLFSLGAWESTEGRFVLVEPPQLVAECVNLKRESR